MHTLFGNRRLAWLVVIVVLLITAKLAPFARLERIDNKLEDNVLHDEALAAYYRFLNTFGNDRILLAAFPVDKIDRPLVRRLFATEQALLELHNVQTVLSPITALRVNLGVSTWQQLEQFLEDERQLERYVENMKKTTTMDRLIISSDWKVGGLVIRLKQETGDLVADSIAEVSAVLDRNMPLGTQLTGVPEITRLIIEMTRRDQKLFSPLTVLLMAGVLWLLYRSSFGLFAPLLAIICALIWTKGTMMAMGNSVNFVTSILPPMVLSVALTFVIHVLTEYFESTRHTDTFDPALLHQSMRHVLRPFLISGVATMIGFGSLIYQSVDAIAQFGAYSALGTVFAMLLALTLVPALIMLTRCTGKHVGSIRWLELDLERLARFLLGNPRKVWCLILAFLAISLYGISILPIETSLIRFLPADHAIQDANRYVEKNLCGIVPVEILLESSGPRFTQVDMVHRVRRLQDSLASISILDKSLSYVDLVQDFDRMFSGEPNHIPATEQEIHDYLNFYSPTPASDPEELADDANDLELAVASGGRRFASETFNFGARPLEISTFTAFPSGGMLGEFIASNAMTTHVSLRMRDRTSREMVEAFAVIRGHINREFAGVPIKATITGRAAMWADVAQVIAYNEITSFSMSLAIITVLMAIFFGSWKVGLTAIFPNVIPVIYTYGIMGLTGTTFSTATGMIASIAIGLAVDDTIHIIHQFKHELKKDGNEHEALVRTMVHKGRATFLTMLTLCAGFVVLTLSTFSPTRYFGIFISIGVAVDLVCELLITPVALQLFRPIPIPPASPTEPKD